MIMRAFGFGLGMCMGGTFLMAQPSKVDNNSGNYYIPQTLSSFSYVLQQSQWKGVNPIPELVKFYARQKTPAAIVSADFANGVKLGVNVKMVGESYSPRFALAARRVAEDAIAAINSAHPETGAPGVLVLLKYSGAAQVIAVAIPNFTVSNGAVIDINGFTDIYKNIPNQVPR